MEDDKKETAIFGSQANTTGSAPGLQESSTKGVDNLVAQSIVVKRPIVDTDGKKE